MRFVIKVIGICLFLGFIGFMGCQKEQPKKVYNLTPAQITPTPPGFVKCVSPADFADSLNAGVKMKMYFIQDLQPEDPAHIPYIPGIINVDLGQMFFIAETLSHVEPLYLVSLYGSDSRRFAKDLSSKGFNCYYLDGGTYRLFNELKAGRVSLSSTAGAPMVPSTKTMP